MPQRGRDGIKEFGTRIFQSNWRLGGTLALSQTTRSSFCRCRRLCPRPRPPQNAVATMRLEPPR